MAFLQKEELKTVGQIALINKIIDNDNSIVSDIIEESISLMQGYLSRRYDAEAIFAAEDTDRHKGVLKKLKDIVIYEIYERHTRDQNAVAARRYNEAMIWLEKLNTGEFSDKTLTAPAEEIDSPNEGDVRFGGNYKYSGGY